jgi:hypothetical protein
MLRDIVKSSIAPDRAAYCEDAIRSASIAHFEPESRQEFRKFDPMSAVHLTRRRLHALRKRLTAWHA